MTSFVVAGAGAGIFSAHRRGLAAIDAQVVAVQDVDIERARGVAEEYGARLHRNLDDLLAESADVALILAPHPFHADLTVAALRAGKHVLAEKPMAVSVAEADAMNAEAGRSGRVLAVCFQQRTRLEVREAKRLIEAGFLGRLQRADLLGTWPRRGTYFEVAPWRGTWRGEGGGVLINQGQHDLDLLVHLAGPPARVTARTPTRLHAIETEDTAHALVEWPGGALGSIHVSTAEVDDSQRIELTGTRGRLRVLPGRLEVVANEVDFGEFIASPGDPFGVLPAAAAEPFVGGAGDHADLYRDFAEALATGRQPIATGSDAARTLELANALILSGRTGHQVGLPLDRGAYAALLDSLRQAAGSRP